MDSMSEQLGNRLWKFLFKVFEIQSWFFDVYVLDMPCYGTEEDSNIIQVNIGEGHALLNIFHHALKSRSRIYETKRNDLKLQFPIAENKN